KAGRGRDEARERLRTKDDGGRRSGASPSRRSGYFDVTGPCRVAVTTTPPAAGVSVTLKGPEAMVSVVATFVPDAVLSVRVPVIRSVPGPSTFRVGESKWTTTPSVAVSTVWSSASNLTPLSEDVGSPVLPTATDEPNA